MSDRITVRVDDECNADIWWDALREEKPGLARDLIYYGWCIIDVRTYHAITALPGWLGGPAHAPHPLTVGACPNPAPPQPHDTATEETPREILHADGLGTYAVHRLRLPARE